MGEDVFGGQAALPVLATNEEEFGRQTRDGLCKNRRIGDLIGQLFQFIYQSVTHTN